MTRIITDEMLAAGVEEFLAYAESSVATPEEAVREIFNAMMDAAPSGPGGDRS